MNKIFYISCLLFSVIAITIYAHNQDKPTSHQDVIIGYNIPQSSDIKHQTKGYYCEKKKTFKIVDKNDTIAIIEIGSPSVVAIADKEYPWGWFQFPIMGVNKEGHILVRWSMKNDSAEEYGKPNSIDSYRFSFDGGISWIRPSVEQIFPISGESVNLSNGDYLAIKVLPLENVSSFSENVIPIFSDGETDFYRENTLPNKYQGIYETYLHKNSKRVIHADVYNEGLIRAVTNNKLTTFWFGKLLEKNSDIYACVYPTYYLDNNGIPDPIAITCYKSSNQGESWHMQGKIDYKAPEVNYRTDVGLNKKGFTEPTFEFLRDNKMLCVMRTSVGKASPMYKSYSEDYGVTWSTPAPITPNGVMPQLIRLGNDVLVLASGRPGIQLRFSCDGTGEFWSEPIELIDYDETQNWVNDTCGYPFLFKASDNEIYIVYSNFKWKNIKGENRKSIMFRKINVQRL